MCRSSTACDDIQETWLASATQPRSIAGASLFLRCVMPRSPKGERRVARSPFRPLQSPSLALNPATKACHGRPCRPRGRINVRDEIGSRARLPRWLLAEKQLRGSCHGRECHLGCRAAVRAGGVPNCVGYGTQAHGGIYWAFAIRQLSPQGIGSIRLDNLPLELREP